MRVGEELIEETDDDGMIGQFTERTRYVVTLMFGQ